MTEGARNADASRAGTHARAYLWWGLLVLPLWVVIALCVYWEPLMGDGWGHFLWHRATPVTLRAIIEFGEYVYLYENPRLGQLITALAYIPGPYHAIAMPLVELGLFALLTTLALGRWPSVRRTDDALAALFVVATIAACVPQIGPMLFYRPFSCNYTVGLVLNVLWLVPYRLELTAPRPRRLWLAPLMLVLGVAAGLCNEHTGIAFLAMAGAASWIALRRGGVRVWMIAGLGGLALGYFLLLTAPGQQLRYGGLAVQTGVLERVLERGVLGNLRVIGVLAVALAPALPLVAIGAIERRRGPAAWTATARAACIALALGGLTCTLTLLLSPKIGPRLFLASVALVGAGLAGWLVAQLRSRWARWSATLLAAGALGYVAARLLVVHATVGPLAHERLDRIQHSPPGSVLILPRYPVPPSRYFLGEDFWQPRREGLAAEYGLKAIELRP